MKCQILFIRKIKTNISKCRLLKTLPACCALGKTVVAKLHIKCGMKYDTLNFINLLVFLFVLDLIITCLSRSCQIPFLTTGRLELLQSSRFFVIMGRIKQRVAWHSCMFYIWRWERINWFNRVTHLRVAQLPVPFSATGYPLNIFLFTTQCCGWEDKRRW